MGPGAGLFSELLPLWSPVSSPQPCHLSLDQSRGTTMDYYREQVYDDNYEMVGELREILSTRGLR